MELAAFNLAVPRYTSYPTAPQWNTITPTQYEDHLTTLRDTLKPVSLYLHIPFCHSMCLYCGCSVVLNRKPEKEARYVASLLKEIDLVASYLHTRPKAPQVHFGGGTPTKLTEDQLTQISEKLHDTFDMSECEYSMEIDPRTILSDDGHKLAHLKSLGFNRVSFGVQDTNWEVQEAVKRRQSLAETQATMDLARRFNFDEINIDLIYGLPHQTETTFGKTCQDIIEMRPNRIAMYSYAKVPWLKPHQKAIKDETLPGLEEKFAIYVNARDAFIASGYVAIGMDHFALPDDSMALALETKQLQRNFQGYSLKLADDLLGFGITATGFADNLYVQNVKELETYYSSIERGILPVLRGHLLSLDDIIRKWTIHTIMSDFELDTREFERRWHTPFGTYFKDVQLDPKFAYLDGHFLRTTEMGALFVRIVGSWFDAYYKPADSLYSRAV